jgi:2-keto-4-pentenoate hydratase
VSEPEGIASGQPAISTAVIRAMARELFEAERTQMTIPPLTDTYPEMTVANAYAVQQEYARLRIESGAGLVGHKIGATSKAIQELFSIDTPDYGHLFDDMRWDEEAPLPARDLIQPLAEPEIAFVLDEELRGPGLTARDVLDAARGVAPCIEIIDSRIDSWRIRLADTVADNGSSARFIVGSVMIPVPPDLRSEAVVFERNGEVVGRGTGEAVLGDPAHAAAWLANALGEFGQFLAAGSVVLSGSITSAVQARPGDRFIARFSTLGDVSCWLDGKREGNEGG